MQWPASASAQALLALQLMSVAAQMQGAEGTDCTMWTWTLLYQRRWPSTSAAQAPGSGPRSSAPMSSQTPQPINATECSELTCCSLCFVLFKIKATWSSTLAFPQKGNKGCSTRAYSIQDAIQWRLVHTAPCMLIFMFVRFFFCSRHTTVKWLYYLFELYAISPHFIENILTKTLQQLIGYF